MSRTVMRVGWGTGWTFSSCEATPGLAVVPGRGGTGAAGSRMPMRNFLSSVQALGEWMPSKSSVTSLPAPPTSDASPPGCSAR